MIFFGWRHVRANIAVYAYLYGIKNHPSLKMHRLLHSRRAESSSDPRRLKRLSPRGGPQSETSFPLNFYYFIETDPASRCLPRNWQRASAVARIVPRATISSVAFEQATVPSAAAESEGKEVIMVKVQRE